MTLCRSWRRGRFNVSEEEVLISLFINRKMAPHKLVRFRIFFSPRSIEYLTRKKERNRIFNKAKKIFNKVEKKLWYNIFSPVNKRCNSFFFFI